MKSKDLLTQITELESALNSFSFEELTTSEAARLKKSFDVFKSYLEAKIWGDDDPVPNSTENAKQSEKEETSESEITATSVEGMKILVFEDNPLNQWLVKKRLKSWGCEHYVAENPLYGLKILEEQQIDLVLMDLHMPVMDGYEVTRRIRANPESQISDIPIIALTADFTIEDQHQSSKDGINDFILKPFTQEELLEKLIKYGRSEKPVSGFHGDITEEKKDSIEASKVSDIDLTPVLVDCMGEVDMLEDLVELYKRNALEFIGKSKLHLQNCDYEQLQFATHKIKAGLAMMQTQNLLILVEQMHEHCKTDQNHDQMEFLYQQFLKEYPMVEFALDSEVVRLKKNS